MAISQVRIRLKQLSSGKIAASPEDVGSRAEVKPCQVDIMKFSLAVICELPYAMCRGASLHAANNLRPIGVV